MLQLLSLIPESSAHEEAQPGDRDFSAWVSLWKQNTIIMDVCIWLEFWLLNSYTLTSVCIFSILFSLHFLRCRQGEFVRQSRAFFFFFYYHGCLYLTIVLAFKQLHLNISMHILHTVLSKFLKVLIRRIWKAIKSFFCWRTFPLWLWP